MTGATMISKGDLVYLVADADYLIGDRVDNPKGIVMATFDGGWHRVYLTWANKNKLVDLPSHMLRKIKE